MISRTTARRLVAAHGSPLYVYDMAWLKDRAQKLHASAQSMNCLVRYAVKANPHPAIVRLLDELGVHFDASSEFEVEQLMQQGVDPAKISLSAQQLPANLSELLRSGVQFVATSLHQLEMVSRSGWRGDLAVRINPGFGSGHNQRTTTGGRNSSFGIWHEYLPQVLAWQRSSHCSIDRLHIHIGSGADPGIWRQVMQTALSIAERLPSVETLDIGGGYKVARMPQEQETDMQAVLAVYAEELDDFRRRTGRQLRLEIEPGTWLVANAGILLTQVIDITDTGRDGFTFLKLNTGMNDILRPSMYGAQHPIAVLNDSAETQHYTVVGHNCETGDILTPAPGNPEALAPRKLAKAQIGDLVAIGGAAAYCASMAAHGYNGYPPTKEIRT